MDLFGSEIFNHSLSKLQWSISLLFQLWQIYSGTAPVHSESCKDLCRFLPKTTYWLLSFIPVCINSCCWFSLSGSYAAHPHTAYKGSFLTRCQHLSLLLEAGKLLSYVLIQVQKCFSYSVLMPCRSLKGFAHLPIGLHAQSSPLLWHLQIHTIPVCFSPVYSLVGFCSLAAAPRSYDSIEITIRTKSAKGIS